MLSAGGLKERGVPPLAFMRSAGTIQVFSRKFISTTARRAPETGQKTSVDNDFQDTNGYAVQRYANSGPETAEWSETNGHKRGWESPTEAAALFRARPQPAAGYPTEPTSFPTWTAAPLLLGATAILPRKSSPTWAAGRCRIWRDPLRA